MLLVEPRAINSDRSQILSGQVDYSSSALHRPEKASPAFSYQHSSCERIEDGVSKILQTPSHHSKQPSARPDVGASRRQDT